MKILLAVDGSEHALAAVRHALALRAAGLDADFVLANVQTPASLYEVLVTHDSERIAALQREAGADVLAAAEALLEAATASWESEVAGGEPGHVLVDLAENYGCDAIFLGAGAGAPGAVATAVIAHSTVPVTLVRAAEETPAADDGTAGDIGGQA
jgi:nucleotide-binding universal stress UspA family protein